MAQMPGWALTIVYWLHLVATVFAIGSLVALVFLVIPAASKTLAIDDQIKLLDAIQARFDSLIWFCFFLLFATGLFQMSANPNYKGLFSVQNGWELAIIVKLVLVIVSVVAFAALSWGVFPAIRRAKIRYKKTGDPNELAVLRKRERLLLNVSLFLAALILLATAAARAA
jgi:uncharacterized membrane protein